MNTSKEQNDIAKRTANIVVGILKKSGKTDLQSQIEFIEFMNNEFIKTPVFTAIIQSLKELQAIKSKYNYNSSQKINEK